jgi:hypothetical protein
MLAAAAAAADRIQNEAHDSKESNKNNQKEPSLSEAST